MTICIRRAGLGVIAAMAIALPSLAQPAPPAAKPPPWTASASTTVISETKQFQSQGAELSGTLYLPSGGKALAAIVVTHGAGTPLRGAALYQHLTEMLPPLGIAVFVYDRRGSGESKGNPNSGDFTLLADDAIAAIHQLQTDPRIDPHRIGIWGLSQGGWLSVLAASRSPDVAFAVSISAPMVSPDVQMKFFSTNALIVNGYGDADIAQMTAARQAVDDYAHGVGSQQAAQQQLDGVKGKPWFKDLYLPPAVNDRNIAGWRKEIEHDPLKTLEAVRAPVLVLYGATDPEVPVALSAERVKPLAARNRRLSVAVIAGADHAMQTTVTAKDLMDPAKIETAKPDSTEYFARLTEWLVKEGVACSGSCTPPRPGKAPRKAASGD